jgi:hypothetical protein
MVKIHGLHQQETETNWQEWKQIPYSENENENIKGRQSHSSCVWGHKIYTFGGSFMYNKKRQVRECCGQVIVFDTEINHCYLLKTKGLSVMPRKNHMATTYGDSMVVYGGQFENGQITNEFLNFDLEFNDWTRLHLNKQSEPLMQGVMISVIAQKKKQ